MKYSEAIATPSRACLQEILAYDAETGVFTWKVHRGGTATKGSVAGTLSDTGYIHIKVNGTLYKAHRLAYKYVTGKEPEIINHINHVRTDNRWVNLESITQEENNQRTLIQEQQGGLYTYHDENGVRRFTEAGRKRKRERERAWYRANKGKRQA